MAGSENGTRFPTPRSGGTLTILSIGRLDHLDPQRSFSMLGTEILRCVVRSLMTYPGLPAPEGSQVVPDLAAGFPDVSADGRTYTFVIRPDARFGPPVNRSVRSSDFKYSFERLLAPKTRGRAADYLASIDGSEEVMAGETAELSGVSCPDDRTLVIRVRRPLNDLLNVLALPATSPTPAEVARDHPDDYSNFVVASGPYYPAEFDRDSHLLLSRNPSWERGDDPSRGAWADQIMVRFNTPWEEVLAAIESDRADLPAVVNPEASLVRRYSADPAYASRWHSNITNCARYITMNTTVRPFDDVRVRRAVSFAIDKVALREIKGGELAGSVATSILPPTIVGHREHDPYRSHGHRGDQARARELLSEAGYDGGISTQIAVVDVGYGPAIGKVVRDCLAAVGIDVEIRALPTRDYIAEIGNPGSTMPMNGSVGWCSDWPGHGARSFIRPLFHSDSISQRETTNFSLYRNPEVDALIERAERAPADEAGPLWGDVDQLILADAPCVPWLYDHHFDLISSRLRGYFAHPFLVGADWANIWLDGT